MHLALWDTMKCCNVYTIVKEKDSKILRLTWLQTKQPALKFKVML